ncbi:MAG: hypothetical protein Q9183_001894 [Haloplaca sp. 2 TL-2023]
MDFVTLGMFIIDEIHHPSPKAPDLEVMGGAGLYAALGARLFRPYPASSKVGFVVHQGHDFPPNAQQAIDAWNTHCKFIHTPYRQTTRAYNKYDEGGFRSFHYLNEKIQVDENCLAVEHLMSKTYHFICSAVRCTNLAKGIAARRKQWAEENPSYHDFMRALAQETIVIWEPMPDLCKPAELPKFLDALRFVDVISPNLDEFSSLFGISLDLDEPTDWARLRQSCDALFEADGSKTHLVVIVRLGARGCYVAQRHRQLHLPAHHEGSTADQVIDPTGGGNSFLGGFAIGFLKAKGASRAEKFEEAALFGAVAASFAIEQRGIPHLSTSAAGDEVWNNSRTQDRLAEYRRKAEKTTDHANVLRRG